jgi:hypothetical protein
MTRTEAAKAGERFFTASKACKHDGNLLRYVVSGHCVTCSKRRGAQQNAAIRAALEAAKAG